MRVNGGQQKRLTFLVYLGAWNSALQSSIWNRSYQARQESEIFTGSDMQTYNLTFFVSHLSTDTRKSHCTLQFAVSRDNLRRWQNKITRFLDHLCNAWFRV
uniref:Uncharacterized protein n=1 Tax=Proboscia inermis TaxID=420281 RepID=A0A6T8KPF2_9STRA